MTVMKFWTPCQKKKIINTATVANTLPIFLSKTKALYYTRHWQLKGRGFRVRRTNKM